MSEEKAEHSAWDVDTKNTLHNYRISISDSMTVGEYKRIVALLKALDIDFSVEKG